MKTQKKSTVSKLMDRFDIELKNILLADLKAVRHMELINAIKGNLSNGLKAA